MPIYEFECEECGERFEELVAASAGNAPCPACGSARTRRLISTVSPPGGEARGAGGGDREWGERFEELVAASAGTAPCPACGSARTRRLISTVSPPGRMPRGAAVRSD